MPHECETCRYYTEPWDGPHCIRCGWQELWEPAEDCDNCRWYTDLIDTEQHCLNCDANKSNWEPADSTDQDPGRQTAGSSGADTAAPHGRTPCGDDLCPLMG